MSVYDSLAGAPAGARGLAATCWASCAGPWGILVARLRSRVRRVSVRAVCGAL